MDKNTALAVFVALIFQRVQGAKKKAEIVGTFLIVSQCVIFSLNLFDIIKG